VGFCAPDTPETELGLMLGGAGAAAAHGEAADGSAEVATQSPDQEAGT
jgi:hypothetical protein